jgi:hypothetical protein
MPTGDYKRIETYDLKQLEDVLNDKFFGSMKVDTEIPKLLKEYFGEMTPLLKIQL